MQDMEEKSKDFNPLKRSYEIIWKNVIVFIYFHATALFAFYLMVVSAKWQTITFAYLVGHIGLVGTTAGAHRLWSHRAYKAKLPLRTTLMVFNTIAYQNSVIHWARDHRAHHKFSETDADPHNTNRGLFYSHMGWLLTRKHPLVKKKGKTIDLSDLYADPVLVFQDKYYHVIMPLLCFVLPTLIPMYCWGESFMNAYHMNIFRFVYVLNITWLVNSVAHNWGGKPYEKFIKPAESKAVSLLTFGEGWHNFHHTFPWDYKTAELGGCWFHFTTAFIDFFAKIGWAYDLKTVSDDVVRRRVLRSGDGTHPVWGWENEDCCK